MLQNTAPVRQPAITGPGTSTSAPWLMVIHRFVVFAIWQAVIAACYWALGDPNPWQASVAWWPITAFLGNLVSILLLRTLAKREGITYGQLVNADFRREYIGKDLLALLGVTLLAGPIGMLPNFGLSYLFYGDIMAASELFTLPLPVWAAVAGVILFPLTIAFAELPTYFGYVMPRLAASRAGWGQAILVAAFWLGAQHATLPLAFDARFFLWRFAMFMPFALLMAFAIRWRPRLLPYLMVVHALIDVMAALPVLQASTGG